MKIEERLEQLKALKIEVTATKQAVKDLETSLAEARQEFEAKKAEVTDLTKQLQDAVRADAKATVALLKAEARARLLGIMDRV